jgi:uncharacterized protein
MTSPPAVSTPLGKALPIDSSERLPVLDALRGFALFGVFVTNVSVWFSGRALLPRAELEAAIANASLLDVVVMRAMSLLVTGKFLTIFSFLFGLGFAIQLGRAEQRGASIIPLYTRRLGVLLVIGLSHLFLLWYGDVLTVYSVLGFGLLLFRNLSVKSLLSWAAIFIFVVPLTSMFFLRLPESLGSPEAAAIKAQLLEASTHGSHFDVISANASFYLGVFFPSVMPTSLALLGRFLLGLLAGRLRLFHEPAQRLPLLRKVFLWGLVAGAFGSSVAVVLQVIFLRKGLDPESLPWIPFVRFVARQFAEIGIAAIYVTGFSLLFQRSAWQRLLSVFSPVGRMALTNYLLQTVFSILFFYGYGLGLMGKLSPSEIVAIPLCLFILQIGWSQLWLARFRFGPAEWVWRSLTYGTAQPMNREPGRARGAAAARWPRGVGR